MTAFRIDIQHHFLHPDYVEALGTEPIASLVVSGRVPDWTPDRSVEVMDRHGIAAAVISLAAPGLALADRDAIVRMARLCNDYCAAMRRDHPGRFGFFATLPLPHIDASLDEIAYCFDQLAAEGVCLLSNYGGHYLGDAQFAPIFEELNRRKAVVHCHPTTSRGDYPLGELPAATLEFPFDTTRAVASLLFSGVLSRCPDIRFIFSHAGGTVPFLAERIARLERRPEFKQHLPNGAIAELKRLYFDTALSANPYAFSALLNLVGAEKILFASDFPFAPEDTTAATVRGLQELGLSAAQLRAIERDNALALMPSLA